jgi:taurine dioxygenase
MLTIEAGPRLLQRVPQGWNGASYRRIGVRPLAPTIGAEITGVDLSQPLAGDVFAEVHQCLLEWKVVFFRDQRVTPEQHLAFAGLWGELEQHPFIPRGGSDEVARFEKSDEVGGYENAWHADVTWRERPAMAAILRAVEVPDVGGDTLFAHMAAAYDNLPEAIRDRIDGMFAVHDHGPTFGFMMDAETRAAMRERYPAVEHPVVRTHPETGRKTLFVNAPFTTHLVGLGEAESNALLDRLTRQASVPEYQCRWHWRPGDVAMWDNRAVQHYASSDYFPARRVMERVAIVGDRPF